MSPHVRVCGWVGVGWGGVYWVAGLKRKTVVGQGFEGAAGVCAHVYTCVLVCVFGGGVIFVCLGWDDLRRSAAGWEFGTRNRCALRRQGQNGRCGGSCSSQGLWRIDRIVAAAEAASLSSK